MVILNFIIWHRLLLVKSRAVIGCSGLNIPFAEPSDKMSDAFEFGSDKMYDNVR